MVWFQFLHKWRPLLVLVLDGYNLHARLWRINSARPTKNTASLVQYFLAEYHSPACTEQKHVFCVRRKREHPNLCGVRFNDETRDSAVKKVRRVSSSCGVTRAIKTSSVGPSHADVRQRHTSRWARPPRLSLSELDHDYCLLAGWSWGHPSR